MLFLLKINKFPYNLALNLCVLASGSGSNLKAIIKASLSGKIKSKIVLVISNNSDSGALKTAAKFNIPGIHLSQKLFDDEKAFTRNFLLQLKKYNTGMILLAGYMKKVSPAVVKKFKNRILNIHPALLPEFGGKGMYGIHVHEAVIKSGKRKSGATVHLVDEKYDNGAVVLQKEVIVKSTDDAGTLAKRVLRTEHRLYPEVIKLIEDEKILIRANKVYIKK